MCGRARLSSDVSEIKLVFGIPPERLTPNIASSWNVAPTDPLPVVHYDARDHQRSLEVMRWGLIPAIVAPLLSSQLLPPTSLPVLPALVGRDR
jgi:putative SOS response-associated peptidase YedK